MARIKELAQKYNNDVFNAVIADLPPSNIEAAMKHDGWLMAGSWFMKPPILRTLFRSSWRYTVHYNSKSLNSKDFGYSYPTSHGNYQKLSRQYCARHTFTSKHNNS